MKALHALAALLFAAFAPAAWALAAASTAAQGPEPPVHTLDAQAVQAQIALAGDDPRRYAVALEVNLGLDAGLWESTAEGWRWTLDIASAEAQTLSVQLGAVRLPAGALLTLADTPGQVIQRLAPQADGRLWSPPVPGPQARLRLALPPDATPDQASLMVAKAYHGDQALYAPKALGDAGSCNVDVACPSGNNWRDEIRAAVMVTVDVGNGRIRCSGTLLNNSAFDNRPYILTARHCQIGSGNAASVNVIFNFENPACGMDAPALSTSQALSGSALCAVSEAADTLLIESTDPEAAEKLAAYKAHFAGWNSISSAEPQSGVSLHHPQSDAKKISTYSQPGARVSQTILSPTGDFAVEAWRITWAEGITEPGSSGAGLWNQERQVTGVLSGGSSSCGAPSEPDFFGRLDVAWSDSAELRLHLDPAGTGAQILCGRDPTDPQCADAALNPDTLGTQTGEFPRPACVLDAASMQSRSTGGSGGSALDPRLLLLLLVAALPGRRLRRARTGG